MKIGIDYDYTFSEDPEMFRKFIDLLHEHGHEAVIVTQRPSTIWNKDLEEDVQNKIEVVYAGEGWKCHAAVNAGHSIDIWMDDNPQCVSEPPEIIGFEPNYELTKKALDALIKSNLAISGLLSGKDDKKHAAQEAMNRNTLLIKQIENKPTKGNGEL